MTEAQIWIFMLQKTRAQTLGYLNKLEGENPHARYQLNGCTINSILWLTAHLAVSANFLLLHSTGAERMKLSWARAYGLGGFGLPEHEAPSIPETMQALAEIQQKAEQFISLLSETDFSGPTKTGMNFGGEDTLRSIIAHHIRHENAHAGQLGLICKALGKQTI